MNNPNCPKCGSPTSKGGFRGHRQMYKCKNPECGHRGTFSGCKGGRPKIPYSHCEDCKWYPYAKGYCKACYSRLWARNKKAKEQITK